MYEFLKWVLIVLKHLFVLLGGQRFYYLIELQKYFLDKASWLELYSVLVLETQHIFLIAGALIEWFCLLIEIIAEKFELLAKIAATTKVFKNEIFDLKSMILELFSFHFLLLIITK